MNELDGEKNSNENYLRSSIMDGDELATLPKGVDPKKVVHLFVQYYLRYPKDVPFMYAEPNLSGKVSYDDMISRLGKELRPGKRKGLKPSLVGGGSYIVNDEGELVIKDGKGGLECSIVNERHLKEFCEKEGLKYSRKNGDYIVTFPGEESEEVLKTHRDFEKLKKELGLDYL